MEDREYLRKLRLGLLPVITTKSIKPIRISGNLKKAYNETDLWNWIIRKLKVKF